MSQGKPPRVAYVGMDMLASAFVYLSAHPTAETALLVTGADNHPANAIKRHARICEVPVLETPSDETLLAAVREAGADTLICAAYHRKLPSQALADAGVLAVNLHPSLLPEGRGPAPMLRMAVDPAARAHAGVTMHLLTDAYDAGPILWRAAISVAPEDGYDAIEARILAKAPEAVAMLLQNRHELLAAASPQTEGSWWPRAEDAERTINGSGTVAEAAVVAKKVGGYGALIALHGGPNFTARVLSLTETPHIFPHGSLVLLDGRIATVALRDGILRASLF